MFLLEVLKYDNSIPIGFSSKIIILVVNVTIVNITIDRYGSRYIDTNCTG